MDSSAHSLRTSAALPPEIHPDLRIFFISDPPGAPDTNMAVDEALFRTPADRPFLIIRFYGWDRPSISAGYFQDPSAVLNLEKIRRNAVGFVRRMTGGRSVFHGRELTCSFSLSSPSLQPFNKRNIFLFLHGFFITAFSRLGIPSRIAGRRPGAPDAGADCFSGPSEFELISPEGVKLIGSAQYMDARAALQQTSIPLSPDVLKIRNYEKPPAAKPSPRSLPSPLWGIDAGGIISAFRESLSERFPGKAIESLRTDDRTVRNLLERRYSRDDWNLHRISDKE